MLLRKAMKRFATTQNVEAAKQIIEATVSQLAKSYVRGQKALGGDGQFSESMQYLVIYALGLVKSQLISCPAVLQANDTVDKIAFQKFLANMMSPEEILPLLSPQILNISDPNLADFPPLEAL